MAETNLEDKVALVSGASRGLGRAVARELAAAGAHVVATGRSEPGAATQTEVPDLTVQRTVELVDEEGGSAEAVICDHTDPDDVRRLVDDVLARHGRIDVLVNNAWGGHDHHDEPDGEEVWDEPMEQFKAMLLAGAYSDYVTSLTVLKHAMGPAGAGIILTTTWHTPEPPAWLPYESSKAAKNRLVYALGHHLREKGIPCIAVAPGLDAHRADGDPPLSRASSTAARRRRTTAPARWWPWRPTPTPCGSPGARWTSPCWPASTASPTSTAPSPTSTRAAS